MEEKLSQYNISRKCFLAAKGNNIEIKIKKYYKKTFLAAAINL